MIPAKLINKELISSNIAHIYLRPLRELIDPLPGQFIMLWIPDYEEIPMSVSGYSKGLLRITVKVRGPTTGYIVKDLPVGSYLGIKGPLGVGITEELIKGRGLLISGGIGIAPILYLVSKYSNLLKGSKLIAGFSANDELRLIKSIIPQIDVDAVSEEGPDGLTVIDLLIRKYLGNITGYDYYLVSGPRAVLDQVVKLMPTSLRGYVLAESLMKCGLGFCGSCALRNFLVCRDGPLITADQYRCLIS